ncbi:MAG: tRNA (adenosine(37)-N6)-threonylcarbamoyltransferase complex dimerization subunit type 1 TsaB [Bacteroidales bacterium]|nr:tRNA (adenosine(37)-N6)-threonylcarbamoyltransferase complex dimerization subunit type 1 TsaB [Bacteroidales bacterium]MDY2931699.1 tRNA (adenosine(37)-N6)-threonylcarbamoyltransferase complex dimerization subunit type 1 TsaB [Muribaculaceae bacterium]MDD6852138.1 tRNA (adenosine(37)-N6)-threonylcarbamoyltransferase complex dimerization subunit type 1 TsaB [Bacteroidales bacterium]MDD7405319.1 tRNA (adenosine(37)-N6)-threonylcarbamoyltransferase complex dimerization subunit type 1 TsaB [Bacte
MANILNIETSTEVCSVALTSDGMVLEHREDYEGRNHALLLSGFIEEMMQYATPRGIKIDAVAVSIGPGSYTGLRIGLSEAKGLCFGLDVPLIGIDTLKILVVATMFGNYIDENSYYVPMIDARRMEVFAGVYDSALQEVMPARPVILTPDSFSEYLGQGRKLVFVGNGAEKAANLIKHPDVVYIPGVKPAAVDMLALSEMAFRKGDFIDIAYSTPNYLKEFQATTPKKKI